MCELSRDFPVISGGDKLVTMGDLIDWTPKDLITKVMLEEKVFETWYDGRVVLLGDGKRPSFYWIPCARLATCTALYCVY